MSVEGIYDHYKDNFGKGLTNDRILDWENRECQEIRLYKQYFVPTYSAKGHLKLLGWSAISGKRKEQNNDNE